MKITPRIDRERINMKAIWLNWLFLGMTAGFAFAAGMAVPDCFRFRLDPIVPVSLGMCALICGINALQDWTFGEEKKNFPEKSEKCP